MPTGTLEFLTPPVLVGLIAVIVLVPPAAFALWRQHKYWREAEHGASRARYGRTAIQAALETAPEGYFAWFHQPIAAEEQDARALPRFKETGYCSRRLAVLLDLFRGMEATFDDVTDGFDKVSQDRLRQAIHQLRNGGDGFQIDLAHNATGRRIQARGVRAIDADNRTMADVVWMSDVTEGAAAVDTLTTESEGLKREVALLKAALNGIAEPVWLRDDDLSLIYCNSAYVKAVDGKDAHDVVTRGRELAPRVAVREARALAAAARASGETRRTPFHMVIEGSRRLMEVTEAPVDSESPKPRDENEHARAPLFSDGSGRLTAGLAYDITRQEELEVRLKREAAAHADVLERLGTAIAIFGPDTRLIFFNTAYAALWDLSPGWLLDGPSYATVLDALRGERRLPEVADFPAYKEKELARFNSLIEPTEDVLHLPGGGTLRRVIAPHPMGGLLTTYEDITDRLALERSYNTLIAVQRETIDNLQEAVAVFGAEGQLRLANPAFAELWNISVEALREGPVMGAVIEAFRDFFDDDTIWIRHRAVMLAALDAERQRLTQQGRVVRRDGSVLEFISVPLPDGGALFCYNDVSAPERVAQQLRSRAEALAATDKLRSDFMSNFLVELEASAQAADKDPSRARVFKILVEDMRDLSGIDAGQQTLHLDSFDVRALTDRIAIATHESFKQRGKKLIVDCAADTGWMVGDGARIKQTLYHLVIAALKTTHGDVVAVVVTREGAGVVFAIRYAAQHDGRTPALSIHLAQRITDLHGGSLTTKADGGDTVVTVLLPSGGKPADGKSKWAATS
ncbi:MAG: PAS-domain containing protein [Rhodospirillaceae bacterium]